MKNNSLKLAGKVGLVTGGTSGIGKATAIEFARAGARAVPAGRREKEGAAVVVNYAASRAGADKVVAEITSHGGKAIAVQADIAKKADIERLFAETRKAFGMLDVLVNNAGIYEGQPQDIAPAVVFLASPDSGWVTGGSLRVTGGLH